MSLETPLAAYNLTLLHDRDQEKNSNNLLHFGVYRAHKFVLITKTTPLLERLMRFVQWLFGFISYETQEVDTLERKLRLQWVPADQLEQLKIAFAAKEQQLTELQIKAKQQESSIMRTADELPLRENCQILGVAYEDWEQACAHAQQARAQYEKLWKDAVEREKALIKQLQEKDSDIEEKAPDSPYTLKIPAPRESDLEKLEPPLSPMTAKLQGGKSRPAPTTRSQGLEELDPPMSPASATLYSSTPLPLIKT